MKTVLILGAKGMLGQELVRAFTSPRQSSPDRRRDVDEYQVIAWDREEIDVTETTVLREKILEIQPHIILNAIAYNTVDLCETSDEEWMKAKQLNVELPKNLAMIAREFDATLVHYSTDYVFGGGKNSGMSYVETDIPAPVQRYGQTKFDGEQAALTVGGKVFVVRLSKLFGRPASSLGGKKSFFGMMLEVGKMKNEVQVVDDEQSCFTYAPDLAEASKALVESDAEYGVYHLINEGRATWYEGVLELYRLAGIGTKIIPVSSDHFPRPANRPSFSVLANTKRPPLRPYTEALAEFVRENK